MRKGHLLRHQSAGHLKERPFRCSFEGCTSSFALKHHLTRHEKLHKNPKPFACIWPQCTESFAKHEQLRAHRCLEHTGQALYECEKCLIEFKDKAEFRKHMKMLHSGRVYVCGVEGCGESFNKWTLVVGHRKSEHRNKTNLIFSNGDDENFKHLLCEECGKGPFKSEASFKQHTRTHTRSDIIEGPVHVCLQCDKLFMSKSGLKAHELAVHSTVLPFLCDVCGKRYGYKKLLKRHIERVHGADDVIESNAHFTDNNCSISISNFDTQAQITMEQIIGSTYFKERNFNCPVKECRRRFFRRYDLDRHLQSAHSEAIFNREN